MNRRPVAALLLGLALVLRAAVANAHDFEPGVLVLIEKDTGRFDVSWSPPLDAGGSPAGVRVSYPEGCVEGGAILECSSGRLEGDLVLDGMHGSRMQAIVVVKWRDGRRLERLLSGESPRLAIEPEPKRDAVVWLRLGVHHIATGFDHLAFVAGLLLIVGLNRRLVATITAFTIAHSVTLALAATGVVDLPSLSVEAMIAASVILVAREALHEGPTLARRQPWLVAGLFGLVHGMGFAGALGEHGLPRDSTAFALLFFNLGVELGQLAAVGVVAVLVFVAGARLRAHPLGKPALAYVVGCVGAFWWIGRIVRIVTGSS